MSRLQNQVKKPPVGVEPTIFCLEGRRLIHLATGALSVLLVGIEPTIFCLEGKRVVHCAIGASQYTLIVLLLAFKPFFKNQFFYVI